MPILVRPATSVDAATLAALNAHVQRVHAEALPWRFKQPVPDAPGPVDMAVILARPGHAGFIAERDGVAVGYILVEIVRRPASPFHHAHDLMHIHHIAVDARVRRCGAGTALMAAAKAHAASEGIALITLDVWDFNAPARAFFARHGLVPYVQRLWNRTGA
jgi:ribosomal protein S18 acetylase RimI-like enzyme